MSPTKEARPRAKGSAKAKAKKAKRQVTAPAAKPTVCLPKFLAS